MTDDVVYDSGVLFDSSTAIVYAAYLNTKDMIPLTNRSGGSVVTGDVLVHDAGNAESFETTTTAGDLRPVYIVPQDVTGQHVGATKTILDTEIGYVYAPGAFVPEAAVDGAVSIGEYLKTSSSAKKLTGTGTIVGAATYRPSGACAIALEAAGGAGSIKALLLPPDSYNSAAQPDMDYILIQDEKAQATDGGTFTSGAWRTRDLNTEAADTGNNASVASNQITLEAGTYRCRISAPARKVNRHQTRLYDTTGAAVLLTGTSEFSDSADSTSTRSEIVGRFTISAQSVLEVQHQSETTQATNGFGRAVNFTTEIYTVVELWKEN